MEFARDDKKQRVQLAFTGEETASESVGHTDYSDENYSGKQAEELRKREKKKKEREKETKRRRRKTGGEGKRRENRKCSEVDAEAGGGNGNETFFRGSR